jgi:hypothetical protein
MRKNMPGTSTSTDLYRLDGKVVLIKSAHDTRIPPIAVRGSIAVRPAMGVSSPHPTVKLTLVFPDMFNRAAEGQTIVLDDAGIQRLLASEKDGTFEFTLERELE